MWAFVDADKNDLDGAKTYKLTLPKGIPEARFWSFTLYDNQTRSMLDTPQRYPRAGTELSVTRSQRRRFDDGLLTSEVIFYIYDNATKRVSGRESVSQPPYRDLFLQFRMTRALIAGFTEKVRIHPICA